MEAAALVVRYCDDSSRLWPAAGCSDVCSLTRGDYKFERSKALGLPADYDSDEEFEKWIAHIEPEADTCPAVIEVDRGGDPACIYEADTCTRLCGPDALPVSYQEICCWSWCLMWFGFFYGLFGPSCTSDDDSPYDAYDYPRYRPTRRDPSSVTTDHLYPVETFIQEDAEDSTFREWIIDSGATRHCTDSLSDCYMAQAARPGSTVTVGGNGKLPITHVWGRSSCLCTTTNQN